LVPTYDIDGNATAYPLPAYPGELSVLAWDGENRLVAVTDGDGPPQDAIVTTYGYDFQGRRISKKVGSGPITRYIYEGWNVIAEYTETAIDTTLDRTYTWGSDLSGSMQGAGGVGGLLAVHIGSANYYPTYDGNGNVSEYLDANGAVAAHFEYDAFGNETVATIGSGAPTFAHRFSTKPLDAESILYYYGYRSYDPVTGGWLTRDPIEEAGGVALFAYVRNNPIDWVDPTGLIRWPTKTERAVVKAIGPYDAWIAKPARSKAERASQKPTKEAPAGSGWGGEQDALRHCIWVCEMAKAIGEEQALEVGDLIERASEPTKPGKQPEGYVTAVGFDTLDRVMDTHNNKQGAKVFKEGGDCEEGCRKKLKDGCLKVNAPGGYKERTSAAK
jgi:RHS repeat-associated protein